MPKQNTHSKLIGYLLWIFGFEVNSAKSMNWR